MTVVSRETRYRRTLFGARAHYARIRRQSTPLTKSVIGFFFFLGGANGFVLKQVMT